MPRRAPASSDLIGGPAVGGPGEATGRAPDLIAKFNGETRPGPESASLATHPQETGDEVDARYKLVTELGHGGMGVVYLAEDTRLQRRVAIKFLRAQATETDLQRFRREAQLLASLSHPNVVKVFDLGEHEERPYFVMEFLDGRTLADHLHDAGGDGLPVDVALGFGRQLCEALEAVHRQGIIHRDIKPGNVIITSGGTKAVLMDFGLARKEVTAKERGTVSGTPQYLPPEDIRGTPLSGDDARRSDIYALGITLFELMVGRPPFSDDNTAMVLHHQLHDPPPRLCDLRPDVPSAFEAVIMRALAKDPFQRQSSCGELVVELARARDQVVQRSRKSLRIPVTADIGPTKPQESVSDLYATMRLNRAAPQPVTPVVALVLNGGPLREGIADALRLELADCEVAVLPSGSMPVLDALHTLVPATVVIDMELLEESPVELCAQLRSAATTAGTPILVVAEELASGEQELLTRVGVNKILPKPIDAHKLAVEVRKVMTRPS